MLESLSNKVAAASFPVKFAKFLITPFFKEHYVGCFQNVGTTVLENIVLGNRKKQSE